MLRGLRVAPAWHRRRIGSRLLRAFVADLGDEVCYCVPYTHLVPFYGEVGFKPMRAEDAPPFLLKRLAGYKRGGMDVLLMRWP
jgi:predicted N-acetyltransferase YhbS